ncbi:VirD4-like conjugal transfer protein, CD1115 family, partial [Paenibacillus alvei]
MVKSLKIIGIIILVLLFHGYVAGAGISAFMTIDKADWTNGELSPAMSKWEKDYLNPLDTYGKVLSPKTEFQVQVSHRTIYSLPITLVFFLIVFYGTVLKRKTYKEANEYGSHGTARWATKKEIIRKGEITGNPYNEIDGAGVVLGYEKKLIGKGSYITIPPDSELNQNIMIYGGSGVGKDFTYIKTQIFHTMVPFIPKSNKRNKKAMDRLIPREYSLFIVDPKGECYRDTAEALEEDGYEVYSFNLTEMKASHRWNALDYIDNDIEATRLANLIISNGNEGHGGDPFWPKAERALMTAVILFVKYETPPNQQNLPNVLHIGMTYNNEDELDILFESLPYNHPALANYRIFKQAPSETRAGILIGFGTQLLLFANRDISLLTSQSDFRLDEMGKKKTALFLIIPDGDTTFAPITSLFITQAFQQWWKVANDNCGTCPVGIRVLGNEWANIGRVPMLAERASVMRSKGVSIQIVLQAKSQLEKLYEKDADIILQNCDTIIFLGTNDTKTAEQMEKDLGEMTIEIQNHSQQAGSVLVTNAKVSTQHQARKLRTANEIKKNSRRKNIIIQNASNPFETIKTPFIEHPLAKGFKKRDPKTVVPPKHRGFELFSRDDYNVIVGLVLEPSSTNADEVIKNIENQQVNGLDLLDDIHLDASELPPMGEQSIQGLSETIQSEQVFWDEASSCQVPPLTDNELASILNEIHNPAAAATEVVEPVVTTTEEAARLEAERHAAE